MPRPPALVLLVAGCGAAAAADVVILPDGFVLQGKHVKEKEFLPTPNGGTVVAKANGFDRIEDGPRFTLFSQHVRTGGKLEANVPRPEFTPFTRKLNGPRGTRPNVAVGEATAGPFNDKWEQVITGTTPPTAKYPKGTKIRIVRQVTGIDPLLLRVDSSTHAWKSDYQTSEYPPGEVRKFLASHKDLVEPPGKPDPGRRLRIAGFFKDVSETDASANGAAFLDAAKAELTKLRADVPNLAPGDAAEAGKLADALAVAETRRACDELEAATQAGRWQFARAVATGFTPSALDPKEALRFAALKTTVDTTLRRFEQTARLLDDLLVSVGGPPGLGTVGGGLAAAGPLARQSPQARELFDAAVAVRGELHPDTAGRLELFAGQADSTRRFGGANAAKPEALLALAVSGALKGRNGADPDPAAAARAWAARSAVTRYLRADTGNARKAVLDAYQAVAPVTPDELAQVVTLVPPPDPLDLTVPGTAVPPDQAEGAAGVVRRVAPPTADALRPTPYALRLPAEFFPGRTYPVILALADPQYGADRLAGRLQEFADRFGYVVAAPVRAPAYGRPDHDYRGYDHPAALAVLRDVCRRVRVDPDRVFLFGYGAGADFAVDLGLARPDRFAGVVANGATPPAWLSTNYWRNAQKLPMYFVCGELGSSYTALRPLFEKWTARGYPALATVYRGRSSPDFFPAELPRVFDWMGRKTRVRGTASLRLGPGGVDPWQVIREADDRFYWVGVGAGGLRRNNLLADRPDAGVDEPARFKADIGRTGGVEITDVIGVRKFVVWLERDLINWANPLAVTVNGKPPLGYKPRLVQPDVGLMLEEVHRTGDTKMLYLGKLEVDGPG